MIALDSVFLVLELGAGYWVGSLALIADAFHMVRLSSHYLDEILANGLCSAERYHLPSRWTLGCYASTERHDR